MPPRQRSEVELVSIGDASFVQVRGPLDETFDASRFVAVGLNRVVIDLHDVMRVTSSGLRSWLLASRHLAPFWLIQCRPAVVSALNVVGQFAEGGSVVSFYAPYVCDTCQRNVDVFIDRRLRTLDPQRAPTGVCPACGNVMRFDEIETEYFAHMTSHPLGDIPADVDRIIDAVRARNAHHDPGEKLRDARARAADAQLRVGRLLGQSPKPLKGNR